jgi:hypothetical protein
MYAKETCFLISSYNAASIANMRTWQMLDVWLDRACYGVLLDIAYIFLFNGFDCWRGCCLHLAVVT